MSAHSLAVGRPRCHAPTLAGERVAVLIAVDYDPVRGRVATIEAGGM